MLIYVLMDPLSGEIRYVGITSRTLKQRLKEHLKHSVNGNGYKDRWLRTLTSAGLSPIMRLLQEVPELGRQDAEKYWIAYFRSIGCRLTNLTDGGDGLLGYKMSDDHKSKISAANMGHPVSEATRAVLREKRKSYRHTDETRAKMSASLKGKKRSEEVRAKMVGPMKGKKHTEETRAKMSEARKSYVCTDETRAKMSISMTGKTHTAETREKMSKSRMGIPLSDAHKKALSVSHMGQSRPMSEETKKKMSLINTGRVVSEATRAKMRENSAAYWQKEGSREAASIANSGRTISEDHKKALSDGSARRWEKWRLENPAEELAKINEAKKAQYQRDYRTKKAAAKKAADQAARLAWLLTDEQ